MSLDERAVFYWMQLPESARRGSTIGEPSAAIGRLRKKIGEGKSLDAALTPYLQTLKDWPR